MKMEDVNDHVKEEPLDVSAYQLPPVMSNAEQIARQRADYAKKEFHKNRKILIEDVPPVTYEEVKEFMGGYKIANINISRKTRNAYVILKHGEEAEEIVQVLQGKKLLDKEVRVSIKPNETLLCMAHLPFNLSDEEFRKFACQFGIIEKCFLMRNERTGDSKGYGLVEYTHNRDHTNTARLKIDGMEVHQCRVHCEFILSHLTAMEDLHSKCLFINKLPLDFHGDDQLRALCCPQVETVFCKMGMRNEQPLGFAIVEYTSAADAEMMQARLHGHEMAENKSITATFCIPGMSGREVYNKALNTANTGRSAGSDVKALGLIPMPMPQPFMNRNANTNTNMWMRPPPPPQVTQGLRNLFQQLQVMQQNMNQLMQGQGGPRPPGPPHPPPGMGFMGPPPNMMPMGNPMMQQAIALLVASLQGQQQQQQLMMGLHGLQAMLQQQQQNTMGPNCPPQQALMGNPIMLQTNNFLQALLNQLQRQQQPSPQSPPDQPQQPMSRPNVPDNRHVGLRQNMGTFPPNQNRGPNPNVLMPPPQAPPPQIQTPKQPPPQLQTPPLQQQNQNAFNKLQQLFMNLQRGPGPLMQQPWQIQPNQQMPNNMPQNQGQALLQTILTGVMQSIMNLAKQGQNQEGARNRDQQGRNEGQTHSERPFIHASGSSLNRSRNSSTRGSTSSLDEEPGTSRSRSSLSDSNSDTRLRSSSHDRTPNTRVIQGRGGWSLQDAAYDGPEQHERAKRMRTEGPEASQDQGGFLKGNNSQGDNYSQSYITTSSGSQECQPDYQYTGNQPPPVGQGYSDSNYYMYNDYNNYMSQLQGASTGQSPSTSTSSTSQPSPNNAPPGPTQEWVNPLLQQHKVPQTNMNLGKSSREVGHGRGQSSTSGLASQNKGPDGMLKAMQEIMAKAQNLSGGMPTSGSGSTNTPVNPLKRSANCLLPSPEPSPEGNYIGQHSQGIGGHYSDSYVKRKRLL